MVIPPVYEKDRLDRFDRCRQDNFQNEKRNRCCSVSTSSQSDPAFVDVVYRYSNLVTKGVQEVQEVQEVVQEVQRVQRGVVATCIKTLLTNGHRATQWRKSILVRVTVFKNHGLVVAIVCKKKKRIAH